MANESPLLHDGSQNLLSTTIDARRSSLTGSTLAGPNGSAQFFWTTLSTTVDRTILFASTAPTTPPAIAYGVLQNTPGAGQAADVGIFGISKVIAASTGFRSGGLISPSSTSSGLTGAWATGQQYLPSGLALETPSAASAIVTAMIFQGRMGGSS